MNTVARNSIHTSFDVGPESPDGQHLCWFRFDGKPLTNGTVMLGQRDGSGAIAVQRCAGDPHEAARQGWLDDGHIYFSAAGQVHIADLTGRIVRSIPGAIDTIHQGSRRGLLHSAAWRKAGGNPDDEACWRLDLDDGRLTRLLDRATAFRLLATQRDLTGVPEECLTFKHTKWAPDGRRWLAVFTNEGS